MTPRTHTLLASLLLLFLAVSVAGAQPPGQQLAEACPDLVEEALILAGDACASLGRNEICYGHNQVEARDVESALLPGFSTAGDVAPVEQVAVLQTAAPNIETRIWGVAILLLQANIPGTLPGQAVTFVVIGDTELVAEPESETAGSVYTAPMQAFSLRTGIGQPVCRDVPRDGVLIQSPQGTRVDFRINGVEVRIGSTAFLTVPEDSRMQAYVLEGIVAVTADGVTETAAAGETVTVADVPEPPREIDPSGYEGMANLPVRLLPERTNVPLIIPPTVRWVSTNIKLEAGQTFTVRASGLVDVWATCETMRFEAGVPDFDCAVTTNGPGGSDFAASDADLFTLPTERAWALLGKVGDGAPFRVGDGGAFTASASGDLYLGINDSNLGDNVGVFVVTVDVPEETESED